VLSGLTALYTHANTLEKGEVGMGNERKAEERAAERVRMLAPLLEEGLDPAALASLKREACERHGVSERTLRRYLGQYREGGFSGLKPRSPGRPGQRSVGAEALAEAIQLRREVPGRSVRSIIQILEWEGKIEPGSVKRSTLQDHLVAAGYSSSQMRIYMEAGVAARRFQRQHRNSLWQSDYSDYISIPTMGRRRGERRRQLALPPPNNENDRNSKFSSVRTKS
jgi:hypothetical protein